jgi:hypothetical protein
VKRWNIHAPSSYQYEEDPVGEWVEFDDVKAKLDRLEQAEALLRQCHWELMLAGRAALALDVEDFIEKRQPSVSRSASP